MKEDKELIQIRGSGGGKGGSANSTINADDTMFSRQSASFVDILSEGPIKGLVYGESSICLLYTSPSPRDRTRSRMPSSA